jgi:hypothetical protein
MVLSLSDSFFSMSGPATHTLAGVGGANVRRRAWTVAQRHKDFFCSRSVPGHRGPSCDQPRSFAGSNHKLCGNAGLVAATSEMKAPKSSLWSGSGRGFASEPHPQEDPLGSVHRIGPARIGRKGEARPARGWVEIAVQKSAEMAEKPEIGSMAFQGSTCHQLLWPERGRSAAGERSFETC